MKIKVKSSIHIKKANVYFILHSVRANSSYSVVFTNKENEYLYDKETALKLFRYELKKRELKYTERTGKKLPKNTITLMSAIVNLNKEHTLEDIKKIAQHLEKTLDTKVVSIAIHRDEGKLIKKDTGEEFYSGVDFVLNTEDNKLYWVDENKKLLEPVNLKEFEIVKNYHAHIEFMGLDSNGVAIKRNKLSKYYLSKLQDVVAKTLKMERGYNYYLNNKKAPKRLDVNEFKKTGVIKRETKKEVLARVKDLKEENKRIREEFKKLGAIREDYARLEELVRELKEKIKAKNLTIEEMQEEFNKQLEQLKTKLKKEQEQKEKLEDLAYSKKYKKGNKVATNVEVVEFLENKVKELQKKLMQSENRVQQLEEENKKLKEELERLKEEIKKETKENAKIKGYTNFTEFLDAKEAAELEKRGIITGAERTDNAKLIIYTDTFTLKEEEKNEFEIDKKSALTETEIEQAILILVKLRHWDISKIEANGSQSFVKKANRVLEKLKIELKGEQEDISYKPRFKP